MITTKKLILEFTEATKKKLIEKFKKENGQLTDVMISGYLDRFERIKQNLPKKDINQYNWAELEGVVDSYETKSEKRKKINPTDNAVYNKLKSDPNVVYDKDGILVLKGVDKESCIKYGKGLKYCISRTDDQNQYSRYRKMHGGGTPFFIFNTKVDPKNRYAVCVVYTFANDKELFSLTDANNDHSNELTFRSIDKLVNYFAGKDKYGDEIWGKPATFLRELLVADTLKTHELYDNFVDKGTHFEIDSANLSSMGLTELPRYWEMK